MQKPAQSVLFAWSSNRFGGADPHDHACVARAAVAAVDAAACGPVHVQPPGWSQWRVLRVVRSRAETAFKTIPWEARLLPSRTRARTRLGEPRATTLRWRLPADQRGARACWHGRRGPALGLVLAPEIEPASFARRDHRPSAGFSGRTALRPARRSTG